MLILGVKLLLNFLFLLDLNFSLWFISKSPELLFKSLFLKHFLRQLFLEFWSTFHSDINIWLVRNGPRLSISSATTSLWWTYTSCWRNFLSSWGASVRILVSRSKTSPGNLSTLWCLSGSLNSPWSLRWVKHLVMSGTLALNAKSILRLWVVL